MNCNDTQSLFSDLYDDALVADMRRALEGHITTCMSCRSEYDAFKDGVHALQTTGSIEAPERFVEAVTTTLRIRRVSPEETPRHITPPRLAAVPPPKRAWSWGPVGVAASLIVAFIGGYFVTYPEIARLRERNRKLREETAVVPPLAPPDGVVIEGGRQVPIGEYLAKRFEDAGMRKVAGSWVSRDMEKRLQENREAVAKIAELERKLAATGEAVPAPTPEVAEEAAARKLGLEKWGDWYVTPEWKDALEARKVLTPEGDWRTHDELVAAIMQENKLVLHEGRWMTPEQLAGLHAQMLIRRNPAGGADSPVARALDGLEIAPPLGFRNLTLYPLLGAGDAPAPVSTLHEAVGAGRLELTDASALSVRAKNDGHSDVLLVAGTVLVGGRHGRVVGRDTVVPAGKTVEVRVYDAEPAGAVRAETKFAKESGHHLVTGSVRRGMVADGGQGWVWNALAVQMSPQRKATSVADLYRAYLGTWIEYRTALIDLKESYPRAVGVAVAIGDRLEYVEVFASSGLFRQYYERILMAASMEAVMAKDAGHGGILPNAVASVKQFVESAFGADAETFDETVHLRVSAGRALGRAIVRDGHALHVSLFVHTDAPEPRPTVEITAGKVQDVLKDYRARIEAAPAARRPAVVREMGGVPGKGAMQMLLVHMSHADAAIRRAAIEALGRRGDPDAGPALLQAFRESREARRDMTVFAAAADALARMAHADAMPHMLTVLDSKDVPAATIVAERLPTFILQQKRDNASTAIGRMIDAIEGVTDRLNTGTAVEADAAYRSTLAMSLRATTGLSHDDAIEFRRWWNDPTNRKRFLDGLR